MSVVPLSKTILESKSAPPVPMLPGVERKTLLYGDKLMFVHYTLKKGAKFPWHSHPHEQAGFILSGALDYKVPGHHYVCREGCAYFAYAHQPHAGEVVEDCVLLDAFSPPRRDYLPGGTEAESYVKAEGEAPPAGLVDDRPFYLESRDVQKVEMFPGFFRQTLMYGKELMLILFSMKAGADLPDHGHPHEQSGFVVKGAVQFTVGGNTYVTRAGCNYFVPSGVRHQAKVLEDALVLDAFSPIREDYVASAPGMSQAYAGGTR